MHKLAIWSRIGLLVAQASTRDKRRPAERRTWAVDREPIELACRGGNLLVSDERVVRRGAEVWALWRSQITGVGCTYRASDEAATVYLHLRDGRRFAVEGVAPRECFVLFGLLGYEAEPRAAVGRDAQPEVIELGDSRYSRIIADARGVSLERSRVVAWALPRGDLVGVNVSSAASDAVVQIIGRNSPVALLDDVPFAAALRLLLVLGAALATPASPVPAAATETLQAGTPLAADNPGGAATGPRSRATDSPAPAAPGRPRATNAPPGGGPRATHAPVASGGPPPRATNAPLAPGRPRVTNAPVAPAGPRVTNATRAPSGAPPAPQQGENTAPLPPPSAPHLPRAAPYPRQSQAPLPDVSLYPRQSQVPLSAFSRVAAPPPAPSDLMVSEATARLGAPRAEPRRRLALGLGTAAALLLLGGLVLAVYGGDFVAIAGSHLAPRPTLTASPPSTPVPSAQASPTPVPKPTTTRAPSPTPKPVPTATRAPSPTPKPSPTPSATVTPTPTATPTATPSPSPTPSPTPVPTAQPG